MQVKRFVAADMRRALEMVRQELGPDAIILSSSRTREGVELLTTLAADSDLVGLQAVATPSRSEPEAPAMVREEPRRPASALPQDSFPSFSGKSEEELAREMEEARERMFAARRTEASAKALLRQQQHQPAAVDEPDFSVRLRESLATTPAPAAAPRAAERYPLIDEEEAVAAAAPAPAPTAAVDNRQLSDLQAELADMRFLLEQQLNRLTGQQALSASPVLGSVGRRLERMGFSASLISSVLAQCKRQEHLAEAWADAQVYLARELPIAGRDIVDQGGVFAFVGPTGVGKTTTIGKLAARFVLRHGPDSVALVTTDTYRIAAHDQLRSMARILRVPVRVVDANNSLSRVVDELKNYRLVLIDTAGFRHDDSQLAKQLAALKQLPMIKSLLVLSSNNQQQMLERSIEVYGAAGLKGCILTKLDETASLGEALSVIKQKRLPLIYTTDGQDIPKHLEVARGPRLVVRAAGLLKSRTPVADHRAAPRQARASA